MTTAPTVRWHDGHDEHGLHADVVLANVAPWVLGLLLGEPHDETTKPQGAQLKVDFLLDRLPRLKSGVDPEVAFAGTLHLSEGYGELLAAYGAAVAGGLPDPLPGEVYCHSLTDPSILGGAPAGTHTLTYFGLHTPGALFDADPEGTKAGGRTTRDRLPRRPPGRAPRVVRGADDEHGQPCIEAKIPQDIERDLAMPGGHIFHGDLEWPWAPDRARLDDAGRAVGRPDRPPVGAAVRLRRAPGRRGLGHRRPQRRPRRARVALITLTGPGFPIFPRTAPAGNVCPRFTASTPSSIGRAADS